MTSPLFVDIIMSLPGGGGRYWNGSGNGGALYHFLISLYSASFSLLSFLPSSPNSEYMLTIPLSFYRIPMTTAAQLYPAHTASAAALLLVADVAEEDVVAAVVVEPEREPGWPILRSVNSSERASALFAI